MTQQDKGSMTAENTKTAKVKEKPPRPTRARLTIVNRRYYQLPDGSPTAIGKGFSRWVDSEEQPYIRHLTIGEEWEKIDTGWLEGEVGWLYVENREGHFTQRIPTEEERAEAEAKVVEVGFEIGFGTAAILVVRPTEEMDFEPDNASALRVRSRNGKARITLTMFPRGK